MSKNTNKGKAYRILFTNLLHKILFITCCDIVRPYFLANFRELTSPLTCTAYVVTSAEGGQELCPKRVGKTNNE